MKRTPQQISRRAALRFRRLQRRTWRQGRSKRRRLRLAEDKSALRPIVELTACVAPEFFAMYQHESHKRLVGFVRKLVRLALIEKRTVEIDFRPVKKLYPDGTLLVFAEIKRILARRPGCLRMIRAATPLVDQTLCHLGLYKAMGYLGEVPSDHDDVLHWKPLSGICADIEQEIGPLIENQGRMPEKTRKGLLRGVGEAIVNVTQHAYDDPREDGTGIAGEAGWWAFIREESDQLIVVSCDLGLGVPATVWKRRWEAVLTFLEPLTRAVGRQNHQDGRLIRAAVEESRSRTRLENRGNGFRDIMDSLPRADEGELRIFSNRGCYYSAVENGHQRHDMRNYKHSIFGTLIAWQLKLQKETT